MDFSEYDHQEILDRISRHCPEAMCIYLHCYNRMNLDGHVALTKNQVEQELSESWGFFKKSLQKLARENLLTWSMNAKKDSISVSMAEIEYDDRMDDEEDEAPQPKKKSKVVKLEL